jgi:hypothetical protein
MKKGEASKQICLLRFLNLFFEKQQRRKDGSKVPLLEVQG